MRFLCFGRNKLWQISSLNGMSKPSSCELEWMFLQVWKPAYTLNILIRLPLSVRWLHHQNKWAVSTIYDGLCKKKDCVCLCDFSTSRTHGCFNIFRWSMSSTSTVCVLWNNSQIISNKPSIFSPWSFWKPGENNFVFRYKTNLIMDIDSSFTFCLYSCLTGPTWNHQDGFGWSPF